jgi:hypothetical protein
MPNICERKETRYSIAESRFAFHSHIPIPCIVLREKAAHFHPRNQKAGRESLLKDESICAVIESPFFVWQIACYPCLQKGRLELSPAGLK